MILEEIKDLKELVKGKINGEIIGQEISRLTAAGENYGSLMLKIDIKIKNENGQEETLHTVGKLVPPNQMTQEIFNTQVTFKNEIAWYDKVIPLLQEHQREHGVQQIAEFFPKLYGARINLDPKSDVVDSGAVILLENIAVQGYENADRCVGFNLESSKAVLNDLATFHALVISVKLQKPKIFDKEIKPLLTGFNPPPMPENENDKMLNNLTKLIEEGAECKPYIPNVRKILQQREENKEVREPWGTAIHNDFWVNNVMLKSEGTRLPKTKILDFQVTDYRSLAADVVFFLFSSVNTLVLKYRLDLLIKYYYERFIDNLEQLKVDTNLFPYKDYLKELEIEVKHTQLAHIVFMMFPIFAEKGTVTFDVTETNFDPEKMKEMFPAKVSIAHKERLWVTIQELGRRKWI